MRPIKLILVILIFVVFGFLTSGQNSAQWRGECRNGSYNESGLLKEWPVEGPRLKWANESIGTGWGSAVVTEKFVYVIGKEEQLEYCYALDMNGKIVWKTLIGEAWDGSFPDARSTPTVSESKVYGISGQGQITCMDAITGEVVWKVEGFSKFDGRCTMWGVCESPLIVDDKLIFTPGGPLTTMIALDKNTGNTLWMTPGLNDSTAYVSPQLIILKEKKIIASILANYFFGTDANSGEILWKFKYSDLRWNQKHEYMPLINCNTPLYWKDEIFISKGYDHLGAKFKLLNEGMDIELVKTDSVFDVHHGGMVLHDGYIYGANWVKGNGNWCCINWDSGKLMYETKWESKGPIILADNMLYCYYERRGNLALVKPDPEKFDLVSSFKITKGSGQHWAHPVISNGILYVRHGDALMAYDILKSNY